LARLSSRSQRVRKRGLGPSGRSPSATRPTTATMRGCLFLDRLPTAEEAEIICDRLGIRKRREYDDDTLAQAIVRGRSRSRPARTVTAPVCDSLIADANGNLFGTTASGAPCTRGDGLAEHTRYARNGDQSRLTSRRLTTPGGLDRWAGRVDRRGARPERKR
jgi:hypothetical protein